MFFLFWNRGSGSTSRQTPDAPKEAIAETAPSTLASSTSTVTQKVSCLEFDGIDDYVEVPTLEYDGSHPITMELWVESPIPKEAERMPHVMGWSGLFVMTREFKDTQPFRDLLWDRDRKIVVSDMAPGPANTGHLRHAAAIWDGSRLSVSVDGRMGAIKTGLKADDGAGFELITKSFAIAGGKQWAAQPGTPLADFLKCRITELRISRVARYTKDFKPSRGWVPDSDTLCLYDFREGTGSMLNDRSGKKNHGRIVGATWGSLEVRADGLVTNSPSAAPPKLEVSTIPSAPASPQKTSPDAGWIPLMLTNADIAAHWQTMGPFRLIKGELQTDKSGSAVSKESYDDFDLEFEWKVSQGANGGVYYRANPTPELIASGSSGMEYQVIDNAGFGKMQAHGAAGALWGLLAPTRDATRPLGEWNTARILVAGDHIEHWMNGEKIVDVDVGSQGWKDALGKATERIRGNAGRRSGHILLQSQSGAVSFRNMRLKANAASSPSVNAAGWIDLLAMIVPYSENSIGVWTRNSNGYLITNRGEGFPFPELSFDQRPYGSYELEAGVILHDADHIIINLPASTGIGNLTLGRRAGGAVWQPSGNFDPEGQPAEHKRKFDLKQNVESVLRIRVDVKDNGARVRLSGTVNDQALPVIDRPATELLPVSPPKGFNIQPSKLPKNSFFLHVGQGATATLTRFRYHEIRNW